LKDGTTTLILQNVFIANQYLFGELWFVRWMPGQKHLILFFAIGLVDELFCLAQPIQNVSPKRRFPLEGISAARLQAWIALNWLTKFAEMDQRSNLCQRKIQMRLPCLSRSFFLADAESGHPLSS